MCKGHPVFKGGGRKMFEIKGRVNTPICYAKVCEGSDRNSSAHHVAGQIMSRTEAKELLDIKEYRSQMAGIYTTSVSEATIDEEPMVYNSLDDIIGVIADSVDVIEVLKPIYNFKDN